MSFLRCYESNVITSQPDVPNSGRWVAAGGGGVPADSARGAYFT